MSLTAPAETGGSNSGEPDKDASPASRQHYYHRQRILHPADFKPWLEEARAAGQLATMASFDNRQALWLQRSLEYLGKAKEISPSSEAAIEEYNELLGRMRLKKYSFDMDALVLAAGPSELKLDFLPLRELWLIPHFGFVFHPLIVKLRVDTNLYGVNQARPGITDQFLPGLVEWGSLEFQQRLASWAAGPGPHLWVPFAGRGLSLNLFMTACPWARLQPFQDTRTQRGSYLWDGVSTIFYEQGSYLPAQDYETGLRLDSPLLSLSSGYGLVIIPATVSPGGEAFESRVFSNIFTRLELHFL